MKNIEELIGTLYEYTVEQRSNIMILHDERDHTRVTISLTSQDDIQSYARALVDANAKVAEKMMVCIAEALEDKELKK